MKTYGILLIFMVSTWLVPTRIQAQDMKQPELLPHDLEIELALSAIPKHLRAEAGIYALKRGGYVKVRDASNDFWCLVRRMGAVPGKFHESVAPVCYDAEGSRTLLPAVLDEIRLIEEGMDYEQVAEQIKNGWASGKYTVPGPGIAYMLSPVFHVTVANGKQLSYVPHLMFYGPYKQDIDVGSIGNRLDYVPFIQAPGLPSAMMVVPAGELERAAILKEGQELLDKVQPYIKD